MMETGGPLVQAVRSRSSEIRGLQSHPRVLPAAPRWPPTIEAAQPYRLLGGGLLCDLPTYPQLVEVAILPQ